MITLIYGGWTATSISHAGDANSISNVLGAHGRANVVPSASLMASHLQGSSAAGGPRQKEQSTLNTADPHALPDFDHASDPVVRAMKLYDAGRFHEADRALEGLLNSAEVTTQLYSAAQLLASRPRDLGYLSWMVDAISEAERRSRPELDPHSGRPIVYASVIDSALDGQPQAARQLWEIAMAEYPRSLELAVVGIRALRDQPQWMDQALPLMQGVADSVSTPSPGGSRPADAQVQAFFAEYARLLAEAGHAQNAMAYVEWLESIGSDYAEMARVAATKPR